MVDKLERIFVLVYSNIGKENLPGRIISFHRSYLIDEGQEVCTAAILAGPLVGALPPPPSNQPFSPNGLQRCHK